MNELCANLKLYATYSWRFLASVWGVTVGKSPHLSLPFALHFWLDARPLACCRWKPQRPSGIVLNSMVQLAELNLLVMIFLSLKVWGEHSTSAMTTRRCLICSFLCCMNLCCSLGCRFQMLAPNFSPCEFKQRAIQCIWHSVYVMGLVSLAIPMEMIPGGQSTLKPCLWQCMARIAFWA